MGEIILHVGVHKTGSTSIQRALDQNRSTFSKQGIKVFPGSNHGEFFRGFTDTPENFHRFYRNWNKNPNQAKVLEDLYKYFFKYREFNHLVSSEDISLLSEASLHSMRGFLTKSCGFSTVKVICFLREPLDYLNASLQQYIKPGLISLNEIIDDSFPSYRLQGSPQFSGGAQNILSHIFFTIPVKLINAFGPENTKFIKFETAAGNGLLNSLAKYIPSRSVLSLPKETYSNTSLSHESCLLLAEYNNRNRLLGPDNTVNKNRVANRVIRKLRSIKGRPPVLFHPAKISLNLINAEIQRTNIIVGYDILTPLADLPDKYKNNQFMLFSTTSVSSISSLLGSFVPDLPQGGGILTLEQLTTINNSFDRKFRKRLWNFRSS